tara:strand:- start:1541 stop:1942 length:402 start_codon:yes stop_codon:yes gene_type:complete
MNISPRPTTPTRRTNPSSSSSSPGYGHYLYLEKSPTNSPGYKTSKAKDCLNGKSEEEIIEIQNKLFQVYRSFNPKSDTLVEPTNVAKSNGNEKEMGRNINSTKTDKKRERKECKAIKKNPNNNDDANRKKPKS